MAGTHIPVSPGRCGDARGRAASCSIKSPDTTCPSPFADAMLPDGSRLHVVIPQITRRHMGQPVVRPGPYIETLSPGTAGHRFSLLGTRVGAQIIRICVPRPRSQLVQVSLRGTPRRRENRGGLPADAGSTLGREPAN